MQVNAMLAKLANQAQTQRLRWMAQGLCGECGGSGKQAYDLRVCGCPAGLAYSGVVQRQAQASLSEQATTAWASTLVPPRWFGYRLTGTPMLEANPSTYAKVVRWLDEWQSGDCLLLAGPTRQAKTGTAVGIMREWQTRQLVAGQSAKALFVAMPALIAELRNNATATATILAPIKAADLILMDDFGQEKTSEFSETELAALMYHLHAYCKSVIFTTNYLPDLMVSSFGKAWEPMLRRIQEMCAGNSYLLPEEAR